MDEYVSKLEQIVFKEKYTVRATDLITLFDLHIKQAQFLLESFAEAHKNDLIVKFGLYGHQTQPGDEIGARRYVCVEQEDVETTKPKFTKLVSCTIKSVKEKHNQLNMDYPDNRMPTTKKELINYQKKGFCINEKSGFREDRLSSLLKRLGMRRAQPSNGTPTTPKMSIENNKEKSPIKAIKPEIKQKDLFAKFKSTPKQEIKQEVKQEVENELNIDKTDKIEEEFVKLKKNEKSTKKDGKTLKRVVKKEDSSEDDIDDIEMNDNDDSQIHRSQNGSQQIKRSKTFDSDSDESCDNSKENFKHKNKKQRKRVINFDDSSDESNDHKTETIESKFGAKLINRPKEEESSRLVEEEETYTDEEGYKVHRTVKKIVMEEKKESVKTEIKKKVEPSPAENKKPVVKSKPVAKNQTSIMNFFKPKGASK